jgi:hypothetical protein
MPANDNEPKARKTPAKARAKTTTEPTADTKAPSEVVKSPARSRSRSAAKAASDTPTEGVDDLSLNAPKVRRSVRRTDTVIAASSEAAHAPFVSSSEPADSIESSSASGTSSFQEEVRLRAYLLYAERGYRSESPESDWFQAEREVAYGRQA